MACGGHSLFVGSSTSAGAEILLYHTPRNFVNRQFAQTFEPKDPGTLCILPIAISGRVWYTIRVVRGAAGKSLSETLLSA